MNAYRKVIRKNGMEKNDLETCQKLDRVKLIDGNEVTFIKLKRKYFEAMIGKTTYNVPVEYFHSISAKRPSTISPCVDLNQGDKMMIVENGKIVIYLYHAYDDQTIYVKNPVDGSIHSFKESEIQTI